MKNLFIASILSLVSLCTYAKSYEVCSPDGSLVASFDVRSDGVYYHVTSGESAIITPSQISMTLDNAEVIAGAGAKVNKTSKRSLNRVVTSPYYKRSEIVESCNELTIEFKGNYSIIARAYDDGIAYRFRLNRNGEVTVFDEVAQFNMDDNTKLFASYSMVKSPKFTRQIDSSFENTYEEGTLNELRRNKSLILTPLYANRGGKKVIITESDLISYPGLFLVPSESGLISRHAPCPIAFRQGGHNNIRQMVTKYSDYLAKTSGSREFPWRVIVVEQNDADLIDNDIVYLLATPSKVEDQSWIKPGMVAWDWWNNFNIKGVDFKSGVNNATYKYFIDFASQFGMDYVILDEGWSVHGTGDLMQVIPEIDLEELIAYGNERNVGLILWAGNYPMDVNMDTLVPHYAKMGIKGFKVDFLNRDDQVMIDFMHRLSKLCAEHKMLLDFHGTSKPAGLNRTYPNVLNFEGVFGLEHNKFTKEPYDMVRHDLIIPFVRMVNGPMDYTPGAMINRDLSSFMMDNNRPMSQGTRARQAALYVLYLAPLNMLCDSPSAYLDEPEFTQFIASMPTVWDETVALDSKITKRAVVARRVADDWYIGAITDWEQQEIELPLEFLNDGEYIVELLRDGVNADRVAEDYAIESIVVKRGDTLKVHCASGGGFAAKVRLK